MYTLRLGVVRVWVGVCGVHVVGGCEFTPLCGCVLYVWLCFCVCVCVHVCICCVCVRICVINPSVASLFSQFPAILLLPPLLPILHSGPVTHYSEFH